MILLEDFSEKTLSRRSLWALHRPGVSRKGSFVLSFEGAEFFHDVSLLGKKSGRLSRYKNKDELADEAKVWLFSLCFLHNISNIKHSFWDWKTWVEKITRRVRLHGNVHQISARIPRNCREFTRFTVADFFCDRPLSREGVDIGSSSGQRQFSHPASTPFWNCRMVEWSNKKSSRLLI